MRATIIPLEHAHTDNRRSIYEANGPDFSIQQFAIYTEPAPQGLGNHFHRGKFEVFTILKGRGIVLLQQVSYDGVADGSVEARDIKVGDVVYVPRLVAHTFHLEPGSEMHCFSSERFDVQDTDMHPFPLARPVPVPVAA